MASKKELREKENQGRLSNAIITLDTIARNNNIQRNIRNKIMSGSSLPAQDNITIYTSISNRQLLL